MVLKVRGISLILLLALALPASALTFPDSPGFSLRLDSVTQHYYDLGEFARVEQRLDSLLYVLEPQKQRYPKEYAATAANLAGILLGRNHNIERAEMLLAETLKIFKKEFGSQSPYYGYILMHMANLHSNNGKLEQAMEELQESARVMKDSFGECSVPYGNVLIYMADNYRDMQQPEKAMQILRYALAILEPLLPDSREEYLNALLIMSVVCLQAGNYREAVDVTERLLEEYKEFPQSMIGHYIDAAAIGGTASLLLEENEKSIGLLEQAASLSLQYFDEHHPRIIIFTIRNCYCWREE